MLSNEFLGSPLFISGVVILVVVLGIGLRLLFHTGNKEYRHKSDD